MAGCSATPSDALQTPPVTWMPQASKRAVGIRALALRFQVGCRQGCCLDALLQHQNGVSIPPLQPYKHFFPHSFLQKAKQSQFIFRLFVHFYSAPPSPHFLQLLHFYVFSGCSTKHPGKGARLKPIHKIQHGGSKAGHENQNSSSHPHKQGRKQHAIKS